MTKWEYKVIQLSGDPEDLQDQLNAQGGREWELTATCSSVANVPVEVKAGMTGFGMVPVQGFTFFFRRAMRTASEPAEPPASTPSITPLPTSTT